MAVTQGLLHPQTPSQEGLEKNLARVLHRLHGYYRPGARVTHLLPSAPCSLTISSLKVAVKFTTFRSKFTSKPTTHEGWDEFLAELGEPLVLDNKQDAPLYSPAVFAGEARTIDKVLYVSFGVIDIDKGSTEEVQDLMEDLIDSEIAFLYHTSYRFSQFQEEGLHKCRLIFPFSRPVSPDEWDRVWHMLNFEVCNGLGDDQCKAPNAIYFFPSHPPGGEGEIEFFDGDHLDVDMLLEHCPSDIADGTESAFQAPSPEVLAHIDHETRLALAREILRNFPDAIEGQGGDRQTLKAAFVGHDFALEQDEFWPLLVEYNQNKCHPMWSEKELRQKLKNGYRYSKMPWGWRLGEQGGCDDIAKEDLKAWIKELMRSKAEEVKSRGRMFRKMLAGEPITARAEQSFAILATALAHQFPNAESAQLVGYFKATIEATAHRDVTLGSVMEKIRDAQAARQKAIAEAVKKEAAERSANIRMAFQRVGLDRDTPYSDAEVANFYANFPNKEVADRHWVIRHGNTFYFYLLDRYVGPYSTEEASNAAQIMLAPTRFKLTVASGRGGSRPMTLNEMVDTYGAVADNVVANMALQKSHFDPNTSTLYEAPCPMREEVQAQEHKEVAEWLFLLASKDKKVYEKLLDWMACLPKIEAPCAGLFLYGERGTGKSLLAHACSRLWTEEGPTELQDLAGAFNSKLAKCPVALGDEGPPTDFHGNPETMLLRRIIQEHSRTLRRKFLPDAVLQGAMRVVVTANNLQVLIADGLNLTNSDIEAINERFLVVHVRDASARHYLNNLPKEKRREITHGTAIAEHALHLFETRKVEYGHRLLVEGIPGSDLELQMATSTGLRSEICLWIASYLLDPAKISLQGDLPIVADVNGRNALLVTAKIVHRHWNTYITSADKKPRIKAIGKALLGISHEQRKQYEGIKYRVVKLDSVQRWCDDTGLCSSDAFNDALVKHNLARLQVV